MVKALVVISSAAVAVAAAPETCGHIIFCSHHPALLGTGKRDSIWQRTSTCLRTLGFDVLSIIAGGIKSICEGLFGTTGLLSSSSLEQEGAVYSLCTLMTIARSDTYMEFEKHLSNLSDRFAHDTLSRNDIQPFPHQASPLFNSPAVSATNAGTSVPVGFIGSEPGTQQRRFWHKIALIVPQTFYLTEEATTLRFRKVFARKRPDLCKPVIHGLQSYDLPTRPDNKKRYVSSVVAVFKSDVCKYWTNLHMKREAVDFDDIVMHEFVNHAWEGVHLVDYVGFTIREVKRVWDRIVENLERLSHTTEEDASDDFKDELGNLWRPVRESEVWTALTRGVTRGVQLQYFTYFYGSSCYHLLRQIHLLYHSPGSNIYEFELGDVDNSGQKRIDDDRNWIHFESTVYIPKFPLMKEMVDFDAQQSDFPPVSALKNSGRCYVGS